MVKSKLKAAADVTLWLWLLMTVCIAVKERSMFGLIAGAIVSLIVASIAGTILFLSSLFKK